jgi:pilus assembly protein CpaE
LPLIPVHDVTHYPDRSPLEQLATRCPTLCFLDVMTNVEQALPVLTNLSVMAPQAKIVVILGSDDSDLILRCLRQGASEFISNPVSADQLQPVLSRLKEVAGAGGTGGGRVCAVLPVKGAVGASTIAVNLAHHWRRIGAKKILLADFDLTSGTMSFLLKVKSNYSFLDALSRSDTLDSDLWKGLVVTTSGIDVLLSPETPVDTSHELPDPGQVLAFCKQGYDVAAVDLGEPYSYWSQYVAYAADEVLAISTNELPSLRATQRVLHHLSSHGIDREKIRLVINRYNPDVGLNQEAIETALQTKVHYLVPSDYEGIQRALVEGRPVGHTTAFGKSLGALADSLYDRKEEEQPKKKSSSSWGALFGSLIGRGKSG